MTRSRRAGQTNAPSMSNGAIRISPTALGVVQLARDVRSRATRRPTTGPPMPNSATSSRSHRSMTARTPAWRLERPLRLRRHRAARAPSGRAAVRRTRRRCGGTGRGPARSTSSRPPAARPSRGPGSRHPRVRRPTAATDAPSPIPTIAPSRTLARRTWAASRPTIRRVRSSGPASVGARWTASSPNRVAARRPPVTPRSSRSMIRISTTPSARARFSSRLTCGRVQPETIGDRVLGLAQLVVEPAGLDEEVPIGAHGDSARRCTDVRNRCAAIGCSIHEGARASVEARARRFAARRRRRRQGLPGQRLSGQRGLRQRRHGLVTLVRQADVRERRRGTACPRSCRHRRRPGCSASGSAARTRR